MGYTLSDPSKKTQNFQLSSVVGCIVGKLTVLDVTATPRKGKAGWLVNAKCRSPDGKPRWKPVGYLSSVEFENRREKVLQLIQQKAHRFSSQSSTGSPDTNHGEKDNTGKTSLPAALLNAPQPRATTTFQTEESIARQIQSIQNKGKSNNMYGRNPSKGNSRMLCVKRKGKRYYRRTLRTMMGGVPGTNYDGVPKGMAQILGELGLYHSGLKRKVDGLDKTNCMTAIFMALPHIEGQRSILAQITEGRGHRCMMLPKFHCELNPMERRWGRAKWYTRRHCNSSLKSLRRIVLVALSRENISSSLSAAYERTSVAYVSAYERQDCDDPFTAAAMINANKKFRSHRGIPSSEYGDVAGRKNKPWDLKKRKHEDI